MNTSTITDESLFESCLHKQAILVQLFSKLPSAEERYHYLIEMGRRSQPLAEEFKTGENIVQGCQSILYLHTSFMDGKVFFQTSSEALISSGLASLLLAVYNGEEPIVILKCPPRFIDELGIHASLTPGRSNGLFSMHVRMKQEALKILVNQKL
jgi:cysteine desulfuration protein SufE